jgi:AcrR family transcriptional regulator
MEGPLVAAPRRSERRPYTVDSLTDVAVPLFIARGYDATRIEHIAKAANISQSSLYHHVRGKEDLLKCALQRALTAIWKILDEPESRDGDPLSRLIHIMRGLMSEQLRLQPEMTLLHRLRGNTATEQWAMGEQRRFEESVIDLVREAQHLGQLRPNLDTALIVHLAFSMSDAVVEWFRPDGTWSHREIVDTVLEVMLDGTRPHH